MFKFRDKYLPISVVKYFHLTFKTPTHHADHISASAWFLNRVVSPSRISFYRRYSKATGKLSPQQVTTAITVNEQSFQGTGVVKSFYCNRLPSNNPIEDRDASGLLPHNQQFMFGVFDGHGGHYCSQAVSERLFQYISVTMAPPEFLEKVRHNNFELDDLLRWYHGPHKYLQSVMGSTYKEKLAKLASEMLAVCDDTTVKENLVSAFMRLDDDLKTEATPSTLNPSLRPESLQTAFQGSCSCVGFIDGADLYIANSGDSQAVLGVQSGEDEWTVETLSNIHDANNRAEIERLRSAHPNEGANMIKNGRLLSMLIPLRAFGDAQFKWSAKDLKHVQETSAYEIPKYGMNLVPKGYRSPPYLTAEPEVIQHTLTPKDKFLVIASDGLFELLSPQDVVQLVGGHTTGHQTPVNFHPDQSISLGSINQMLKKRQKELTRKPIDTNVATHLIRNALGPDHKRISETLSLPHHIARNFRDDMAIIVIHFDSDYIKNLYSDRPQE